MKKLTNSKHVWLGLTIIIANSVALYHISNSLIKNTNPPTLTYIIPSLSWIAILLYRKNNQRKIK